MGENLWNEDAAPVGAQSPVKPQYRENTLRSFLRAAELGVNFVEFDVQVTSDGVPVIWHDDLVVTQRQAQAGTLSSCEVKDLRLDQFQDLVHEAAGTSARTSFGGSQRSYSTQLVRDFRGSRSRKPVGGEPRPWTCALDGPLPTLSDLMHAVPAACGMDIEIKMTSGDDVEVTPPQEVERVVGAIWDTVQQFESGSEDQQRRSIFFSSFDPDVCVAMRKRQDQHDVWFLSGCGLYEHVDSRRTSIAAALDFAAAHNLRGVVLPAVILLANESMAQEAQARGLGLMTYGLENDDASAIVKQYELGVAAAIVDDVEGLMSSSS